MKKSKIKIEKIEGKISIINGNTAITGFKNWSEARKFLKNLQYKYGKTK